MFLKDYCDTLLEEEYILYLHCKGVSFFGKEPFYSYVTDWRNLMLYFNVECWEKCIYNLNLGYDTIGVNWYEDYKYPHYSGNFWWAKSSYIKKLPQFQRPKLINFQSQFNFNNNECRYDAEFWIGLKNPNSKSLHNATVNLYHNNYPEKNYKP